MGYKELLGANGPVIYSETVSDGRPLANVHEAPERGAADAIMAGMPGWAVAAPVELGEELASRGARVLRHVDTMARDLVADPPPPEWSTAEPPGHLAVVPCDRPAEDIAAAVHAAYPPGHPDFRTGDQQSIVDDRVRPLLAGTVIGPLLPYSTLAVTTDGTVAAGVIVTDRAVAPPYGGPWIADVFRLPDPGCAGLGSLLLRRVVADAATAGAETISLAVTVTNPARKTYLRLGFRVVTTALKVLVPG